MAVLAAPAAADPLTLILLRILRDQLITRSLESAWDASTFSAPAQPPAPSFVPAPTPELGDRKIRQLIDDGFVHLSSAQRDEVYAGVQRILADPENAESRPAILEELATKAAAVRQVHDQLRQLSAADKQYIAAQARAEYARLPDEERKQLIQVLRAGAAPIPRDLNELILAEFAAINGR
jgi:hypothetical protein